MIVSQKELDQIRQAIMDGKEASNLAACVSGLTLGAAFECCCANWFWEMAGVSNGLHFFSAIKSRFPGLGLLSNALKKGRTLKRNRGVFDPLPSELRTVQKKEELSSDDFGLFQMRFSRSLEQAGFGRELGRAIAVAFGEMADNIVQHAKQPAGAHGIVGYQVASRAMCFAVADVGQGILKSLSQTSTWKHLSTDREAILAAVREGATSRGAAIQGTGFKQVHQALTGYNGHMRFRSGNAALTLDGSAEPKTAVTRSVAAMGGFQLFVSCELENKGENFLLDSFC
jgi:anti-sigma regulatory factor (Ser/Thr protein kinase)